MLVSDIIGVNEAIAIPEMVMSTLTQPELQEEIDRDLALLSKLGTTHIRAHSARYPYLSWYDQGTGKRGSQERTDHFIATLAQANITPLMMIGPWPGNETRRYTEKYTPKDQDDYLEWVRKTVERYDGDGIDDAPVLPIGGIQVWEIDNEPDWHHAVPLRGKASGFLDQIWPKVFESAQEYALLTIATAEAIERADPTAKIIHGGILTPHRQEGQEYLADIWANPMFKERIDGVNLHRYPNRSGLDEVWRAVDLANRVAPDKPVWITEVSTSSLASAGGANERLQAMDMADLIFGPLHRGVERVYWHSLVEDPDYYRQGGAKRMTRGRHLFVGKKGETEVWHQIQRWSDPQPKLSATVLAWILKEVGHTPRENIAEAVATNCNALLIEDSTFLFGERRLASLQTTPNQPFDITQVVPDGSGLHHTYTTTASADGSLSIDLRNGPIKVSLAAPQDR